MPMNGNLMLDITSACPFQEVNNFIISPTKGGNSKTDKIHGLVAPEYAGSEGIPGGILQRRLQYIHGIS